MAARDRKARGHMSETRRKCYRRRRFIPLIVISSRSIFVFVFRDPRFLLEGAFGHSNPSPILPHRVFSFESGTGEVFFLVVAGVVGGGGGGVFGAI